MATQYIELPELPKAEPYENGVVISFSKELNSIVSLTNAESFIQDCLVTINGDQGTLEIILDTNGQAVQLCLQLADDFGITYREEI